MLFSAAPTTVAVAEHVAGGGAVNMKKKCKVTTCVSCTAKFTGQLAELAMVLIQKMFCI